MTYQEAIKYLCSLQMFGMRLGLDSAEWLAGQFGNPHENLRFIHVAGTNGKGSVCAMLESIYRAAGWRTGLFTSPHLVSFTERIQVNRQPVAEADVVRWVEAIRGKVDGTGQSLTFFEVVTVMALLCFKEQGCDIVMWETGLGGRLDATNIVTPVASVITNIELDHEQWLGTTHEQIATEKAGIIKPGVPVNTAAEPGRGLEVIIETAQRRGCPLAVVDGKLTPGQTESPLTLTHALLGAHQMVNAAVARAVVDVLSAHWAAPEKAVQTGLRTVSWPGRMQLIQRDVNQRILLDGAHNPASGLALREAFQESFVGVRPTLILGMLADKNWTSMVEILAPLASRIITVPVSSPRTLDASQLAAACQAARPEIPVEHRATLRAALAECGTDDFLLITGSLYLVGEAMDELRALPAKHPTERALNDWSGTRVCDPQRVR